MTNEATAILARINLDDHIASVLAAKAILSSEYPHSRLLEELADVADYLRGQRDAMNSPAGGTI